MNGGSNRLAVLAGEIRAAHQGSRSAAITAAERAVAAGTALIEAKRLVPHGKWQIWLRENCGLGGRTARRYMDLAASGLKMATVANLGIRGASEALGRRRAASKKKTVITDERTLSAALEQSHTEHRGESPAPEVKVSTDLDPEGADPDTVIRLDSQELFPDHNQEPAIKRGQLRIERSRWLPQTPEEQCAEVLANLFSSDHWQQFPERFRNLKPKGVIAALKRGPMLGSGDDCA